jgi:DNA (cytosine-5)-methyltransferase 1
MDTYKLIDLFAGTGAFSKAFEKYGVECVFANDICKNSKKIYDLNHSVKLLNKDLNTIKTQHVPMHNILCGGFPCQPFSVAGKRKGFADERSNVFWKILKIIKKRTPEIIILENVKNLQSHDKGDTFKVIYNNLVKLGYHIKYKILNTCLLTNIPQNRERIYIVGFRNKDLYNKFEFKFKQNKLQPITTFLEKRIDPKYYYGDQFKCWDVINNNVVKNISKNVIYQYRRYYVRENKNNLCPTLTANMGTGGHNVPLIKDNTGIRKLTPRECFNLQGFPSTYKLPNVCDSHLYKLAGNAVSLPVVELIAQNINTAILKINN